MADKSLQPPAHLSEASATWWRSVVSDYAPEDHHVLLLTLAAEALDRTRQARELLERDGIVVSGREGGLRPHPAVAIERDSRLAFARLVRELGLDDVDEPPAWPAPRPRGLK